MHLRHVHAKTRKKVGIRYMPKILKYDYLSPTSSVFSEVKGENLMFDVL